MPQLTRVGELVISLAKKNTSAVPLSSQSSHLHAPVLHFFVFQVTAFDTVPHPSDYAGALMIVVAVLGVVLEDRVVNMVKCRYF